MPDLRSDLRETPCVKPLANGACNPYEQYEHDLNDILDKHSPLVYKLTKKDFAHWLPESSQLAKTPRHQFETTCKGHKIQYNNRIKIIDFITKLPGTFGSVNEDKSGYYKKKLFMLMTPTMCICLIRIPLLPFKR